MQPKLATASKTLFVLCLLFTLALTGCNDDDSNVSMTTSKPDTGIPDDGDSDDGDEDVAEPRTFKIEPGDTATNDAVAAFFEAAPGDTIEFGCGFFEFSTGLVMQNTEGVTVKGCGRDKTVLSFLNSDTAEGFLISNVQGVTVSDLTVADTPGDGIKIKSSDIVTYRNVRTMWSSAEKQVTADNYRTATKYECPVEPIGPGNPAPYQPDSGNGRYGIYPVQASNVLLDNVESLGASDAGIYVGQSDDIIIKNSRALYNVAGYEFENTQRAEMFDNIAECNTVGYIIYDLPFLTQYGYQARMHDNVARNNNFDNFARGGIVSQVPAGSGLITLAYDQVEIDNNEFKDHKTAAIIITSYELIDDDGDLRQDIYTEALSIHDNRFDNSGYMLPPPDPAVLTGDDFSSALPALIGLKNGGQGADILWDGLYDGPNGCPKPDVPTNDRGKPLYEGTDVKPEKCGDTDENGIQDRYNAYKFGEDGGRKKPSMWICIENNTHTGSPGAPPFANFHGLRGVNEVIGTLMDPSNALKLPEIIAGVSEFPADRDISPHRCTEKYGETLPAMEAVELETYSLPEGGSGRPTEEQIVQMCGRDTGSEVNWDALAEVDCPNLASYNLFDDPQDPSKNSNGGVPYDLNTRLFSDYARKFRIVFMPSGTSAVYHDGSEDVNATYEFPTGTVIAKTFSFPNEGNGSIDHVETRLLIKREDDNGMVRWVGLPYIWSEDENGKRVATLSKGGGTAAVSWDYKDVHSGKIHQGSTDSYQIPNAAQCVTCHANTHRPAGAPPIGPKPRNLNKPYPYEDAGKMNQIAYWVDNNLLENAPELEIDPNSMIATNVERIPYFNVAGNGGEKRGSDADIEQRLRGYLEVNCAHCHNPNGAASNTGLYLDYFREVDSSYGICKTPTAAGAGSDGRPHDIQPGSVSESIMPFRVGSNDVEARMPPIARSVVHQEALDLLEDWIATVVDEDYENGACANGG